MTRRDCLRVGTLGAAGLGLADLLRMRAASATSGGRARSIIMIHLGGGPSHLDTYDPKPDAPVEIRGEFAAIPTRVDGIRICELFPLQAEIMDRLAIIRSVSRVLPEEHASSLMVTGYGYTDRRTQGDHPSVGSVLSRLRGKPEALIPAYVSLRGVDYESGLGAAHLGAAAEPLAVQGPGRQDLQLRIGAARLEGRRHLLDRVNAFRKAAEARAVAAQDVFSRRALEVVSSSATFNALDAKQETEAVRKRYGNDQFLVARRLIEAGVQCVTLEVGGWDTHENNFKGLRNVMPPLDRAFRALIDDLKDRGLLDSTLVVMWGEFGRTPRVNGSAGRDHWPAVMSALLAGGGLKVGQVLGATDSTGSAAADEPYRVREVVATLYQALGIDPGTTFIDQQQRPVPLIHDAAPIAKLVS
jgi:uncharacterized protein (DUF1501 family)